MTTPPREHAHIELLIFGAIILIIGVLAGLSILRSDKIILEKHAHIGLLISGAVILVIGILAGLSILSQITSALR